MNVKLNYQVSIQNRCPIAIIASIVGPAFCGLNVHVSFETISDKIKAASNVILRTAKQDIHFKK